jgi:hypothetical protein
VNIRVMYASRRGSFAPTVFTGVVRAMTGVAVVLVLVPRTPGRASVAASVGARGVGVEWRC